VCISSFRKIYYAVGKTYLHGEQGIGWILDLDRRNLVQMLEGDHAGHFLAGRHGAPLDARRLFQEEGGRRMMDDQVVAAIAVHGYPAGQWDTLLHFRGFGIEVLAKGGNVDGSLWDMG